MARPVEFDEDNYLKITDRKKDILITPGGDNISPLKIENELVNSEIIDQAIVYGDNKPYLVALLVLNNEKETLEYEEIKQEIENIKNKLSKVGWDSFLIDHEFVHSLYIFDPNGIQLEFTCRDKDHDQILDEDAKKAHKAIEDWTKKTRELKVETFGSEVLDQREK